MDRNFNLKSRNVLNFFLEISRVPRGSGNQKPISNYLLQFGKKLGFETIQDRNWNVIIRKPASPGCEKGPVVMLQAHMDMVCEKDEGIIHDFLNDPIEVEFTEDRVSAKGTTLGADDGIGVAMMMAILTDDTISHPELELVFTADEETDMSGAIGLPYDKLRSSVILNLDSKSNTICGAGEMEVQITFPYSRVTTIKEGNYYRISVKGLKGGHTGSNAMDGLGNAIRLLARVLYGIKKESEFRLCFLTGGQGMPTAYARESEGIILIEQNEEEHIRKLVKKWDEMMREEYKISDPDIRITLDSIEEFDVETSYRLPIKEISAERVLELLLVLPDGLFSIHQEFKNIMECSSNIGVLRTEEDQIWMLTLIRSTRRSKTYMVYDQLEVLCRKYGAKLELIHDLPQWDRKVDPWLYELALRKFPQYLPRCCPGTTECGVMMSRLPHVNVIAMGPPYYHPHSPSEYFLISELEKHWRCFLDFLKELGEYEAI